jgi:hypothetical protein|tara:strand:+ start:6031 stop:6498 length:468 start_codon:yes stop_codon:yes gene_type:complete
MEKKINARCEFHDSEIARLLDRANLPEEVDGDGDGEGYLGGVGGNDDPGVVRASGGVEEDEALPEEDLENLDDSAAVDAQLEALLLERAERIQGVEEARLGRGRRERKTVLPSNVDLFDTRKKKGKKGRETLDGDGDGDGLAKGTGLSQSPHSAD